MDEIADRSFQHIQELEKQNSELIRALDRAFKWADAVDIEVEQTLFDLPVALSILNKYRAI